MNTIISKMHRLIEGFFIYLNLILGGSYMTKCPRCGKDVSSRPGTICPRCGLRVYEVNEKIRCPEPSCKALVSKKLDYCPKCGCKLKGYKFSDFIKLARSKIDKTLNDKF